MKNVTDSILISKVLKRDRAAGELLFNRYENMIFGYLINRLKDRELAKEILQTVFLKAFQNLKKLKERKKFKSWLFTIARNSVVDYAIKKREFLDWDSVEYKMELEAGEDIVIQNEIKEHIDKLLKDLSIQQRDVVKLRIYSELKFSEIAKKLKISENSAKVTYHSAIKKMRNIWGYYGK